MEARIQLLAGLATVALLFLKNLQHAKCNIEDVSQSWREKFRRKPSTTVDLVRKSYNTVCCETSSDCVSNRANSLVYRNSNRSV
jgi:hypothetical protein